ncbi:MAG: NUDIX-like domain-containing protein, partial [Methanobacteriota archaeon]
MYDPHFIIPDLNTRSLSGGSPAYALADSEGNILCYHNEPVLSSGIPESLIPFVGSPIFIGSSSDTNSWVYRIIEGSVLPPGYHLVHLRTIGATLSRDTLGILGRAIQLVRFELTTSFCGRCGVENRIKEDEFAK